MLFRILLFSLFIGTSVPALAQPVSSEISQQPHESRPEPSENFRNRETFLNALRDVRTHNAQDLTFLLLHRSVRDEVKLDDAGWREFRDLHSRNLTAGEKLFQQLVEKQINAEVLKTELSKIAVEADKAILELLEKHKITDRLIGLFVQHRGASAAVNKLVAVKIGLEDPQRQEILKKRAKVEREVFEEAAEDFRNSARNPDVRRNIWEKVQKKINLAVSEELSNEQRSQLEMLEGTPFKFDELGRGGPRPRERDRERSKECCDQIKTDA